MQEAGHHDHECRGLMDAKRLSRQSLETGSRLVTTGAEGLGARAAVAAVRGFPGQCRSSALARGDKRIPPAA